MGSAPRNRLFLLQEGKVSHNGASRMNVYYFALRLQDPSLPDIALRGRARCVDEQNPRSTSICTIN
jgi:hypothetical protein